MYNNLNLTGDNIKGEVHHIMAHDRKGTATELLNDLWVNHNTMIDNCVITQALTKVLINTDRPSDYIFHVKLEGKYLLVW